MRPHEHPSLKGMFKGMGRKMKSDLRCVLYVLSVFGYFSGVRVNRQKTYVLVKSSSGRKVRTVAGVEVKASVRYLGVEQAYVISKMLLRARYISMLPLTLKEKAANLRI